jgi:putative restriction endonuclease
MATGGKLSDLTSAAAVRAAIAEFRRLGRAAFLEKYGFRESRRFFLVEDGAGYDSKPIAAAAYGRQHGKPLDYDDFSGGAPTIAALGRLGFTVSDWTSPQLEQGAVYTREQLKELFGIEDATINTGVFRPKDRSSIWLFVTRDKTSDRTKYEDRFEGDLLHWQGQTAGRTDQAIIGHEAAGDELLVFYRDSKRSHAGAGFRFEGQFRYLSHSGAGPTSFLLQRSSAREDVAAPEEAFDPSSIEDARERIWALVKRRQGQPAFRRGLIRAYAGRCAVTGCAVEALLEAAHIHPYRGAETNRVDNGLLLRADIHTLFDLGMIRVTPDLKLEVSGKLAGTDYAKLHGKPLRVPAAPGERPSGLALAQHREAHAKD